MQPIFGLLWLVSLVGQLEGQVPIEVVDVTDILGIASPGRLPLSGRYRLTEGFKGHPVPFDFDRDGDLDLLLTYGPQVADSLYPGLNRLYRNDDTLWVDVTEETGLAGLPPAGNAAVGDVNGDGFLDLYLCLFGADRLLLNEGGRSWRDITDSSGIANPYWATDAVFLDANQDGYPDIYVANYLNYPGEDTLACFHPTTGERTYCDPEIYDAAPNRLYVNDGTGVFRDMTAELGLVDSSSRSLAVLPFDANGDGRLDIFVLSYRSPNLLYLSDADSGFVEAGFFSGVALAPDGSEPVWSQVITLDANADSYTDLLFTRADRQIQILLNDGTGHFFEGHYRTGLFQPRSPYRATAAATMDVDFNGLVDLIFADPEYELRPSSLATDTVGGTFQRFLVSDPEHRFQPAGGNLTMVLDTTLLVPPMPTDMEEDLPLDFLLVDSLGRPLFPMFPEEGLFSPLTPSLLEALPRDTLSTSDTMAFAQVDSVASDSAIQAISAVADVGPLDTLQVYEVPDGYVIADLTGDGVQEIIATYPVGLVRVWRQQLRRPPQFLGLWLRTDRPGMSVIGAQLTVSVGEISRRYILTDHNPVLHYFPERVRAVGVEVRWPDGLVNHYRATSLNRYYTLTRQEVGQ